MWESLSIPDEWLISIVGNHLCDPETGVVEGLHDAGFAESILVDIETDLLGNCPSIAGSRGIFKCFYEIMCASREELPDCDRPIYAALRSIITYEALRRLFFDGRNTPGDRFAEDAAEYAKMSEKKMKVLCRLVRHHPTLTKKVKRSAPMLRSVGHASMGCGRCGSRSCGGKCAGR